MRDLLPGAECLGHEPLLVWGLGGCRVALGVALVVVASWLVGFAWQARDDAPATVPFCLRLAAFLGATGLAFGTKAAELQWPLAYFFNLGLDAVAVFAAGIWALYAPVDMRRIVGAWRQAGEQASLLGATAKDLDRRLTLLERRHYRARPDHTEPT